MSRAGTKGVPREERERQLLDVATAEFGDRGYAYASVTDIAAAAGVSKPLIYTYFGSRDGLHAACVQRAGTRLVEAVAAAQTVSGTRKAVATLTALFEALDGHPENWKVVYDATLPRPSAAFTTAREYQEALNTMGAEGVAEVLSGADTEDQSLLLALWFSIVSTTIAWWSDHPDQTPEDMTDRCTRLVAVLRDAG